MSSQRQGFCTHFQRRFRHKESLVFWDQPRFQRLTLHRGQVDAIGEDDRPDWGVAGRFEWKATGDWRAYRDFSAIGNKDDLFVLGVGGNADGVPDLLVHVPNEPAKELANQSAYLKSKSAS